MDYLRYMLDRIPGVSLRGLWAGRYPVAWYLRSSLNWAAADYFFSVILATNWSSLARSSIELSPPPPLFKPLIIIGFFVDRWSENELRKFHGTFLWRFLVFHPKSDVKTVGGSSQVRESHSLSIEWFQMKPNDLSLLGSGIFEWPNIGLLALIKSRSNKNFIKLGILSCVITTGKKPLIAVWFHK